MWHFLPHCSMIRLLLPRLFPKEAAAHGPVFCWWCQERVLLPFSEFLAPPFALPCDHSFQPRSPVSFLPQNRFNFASPAKIGCRSQIFQGENILPWEAELLIYSEKMYSVLTDSGPPVYRRNSSSNELILLIFLITITSRSGLFTDKYCWKYIHKCIACLSAVWI